MGGGEREKQKKNKALNIKLVCIEIKLYCNREKQTCPFKFVFPLQAIKNQDFLKSYVRIA